MADVVDPVVYPFLYHQSRHYHAGHAADVRYWPLEGADARVVCDEPMLVNRLLSDFEIARPERSGLMLGEYAALSDGLFLIDRKANCFSINFPNDHAVVAGRPYVAVNAPEFWEHRRWLMQNWDSIPVFENATVWSHVYHNNYYHFTFEFLQKARLTAPYGVQHIIMPSLIYNRQFKHDLLARAVGGVSIVFQDGPARVINPVLAEAWQSYEGLGWLRRTMKLDAQPGKARYYVRRAPKVSRPGNNIAETPEFMGFLTRHGFQTLDFGGGELSVAQQVEMLKGAAVVLSPHGAGLTNIAYLNPPTAVIEVFGTRVLSASFMQIAICLGLKYVGLISQVEDANQCMVADVPALDAAMAEILG